VALFIFSARPLWRWLTFKAASAALVERTRALVEKNPQLKPAWDNAMKDGTLSWEEAKEIVEQAGETVRPDE
jgi:hypothetical protein